MSKKFFIIAVVIMVIAIFAGLFYWFGQYDSKIVVSDTIVLSQPIVKWQKITITESDKNIAMYMRVPRIIIYDNYRVDNEVNRAITQHIESLKDDFISVVAMAAEDNGEANILNVKTEVLLATSRLISLAFTSTEDFSGIVNDDSERTFIIFDLVKGELLIEDNEMFSDDIAWSRAVKIIKNYLLADYQGDPSCDLSFAPKYKGFVASCIGIDRSRDGGRLSITGDISLSMIQEFLAPSVLSDIIQ
ncbi:MAG: hypothetical protein Q8P06_01050 [Candidatus Azambacteria bacterium]|nr:hypothetical protein [Candidatus Azambacteria bacterium]